MVTDAAATPGLAPVALASVAVGRPVRGPFTYLVPPELQGRLQRGQRLLVPFGRGRALGFYLGPAAAPPEGGGSLKPVSAVLEDTPALPEEVLALVEFAAAHYRSPLGEALRAALPPGMTTAEAVLEARPEVVRTVLALPGADPDALRRAPAGRDAGVPLAVGGRAELDELGRAVPGARDAVSAWCSGAGCGSRARDLADHPSRDGTGAPLPPRPAALVEVEGALDAEGFSPSSSGRRRAGRPVYLRAVDTRWPVAAVRWCWCRDRPHPQLVGRFRSVRQRWRCYSGLKGQRAAPPLQALRSGAVRLAVGVSSAVFAPGVTYS